MTERKWTAGPWDWDQGDFAIYELETSDEIATIDTPWRKAEMQKANACLIAAAPELYEALEKALNYIENTESELGITLDSGDAARAALAKARGET